MLIKCSHFIKSLYTYFFYINSISFNNINSLKGDNKYEQSNTYG